MQTIQQMEKVSTSIILDKRYKKKEGDFAVKLRITHRRKQFYYPLNISMSIDEWEKVCSLKPRGEFKEKALLFNAIETKANEIIQSLNPFTIESFEKAFNKGSINYSDVFESLERYIETLDRQNRMGTKSSYECTVSSFKAYCTSIKKKSLEFHEITQDWLEEYEKWMITNQKSLTTIGIYLRNLRTVFNNAIADGNVNEDIYPFGRRKYTIPSGRNVKKALKISDVEKIYKFSPENESACRAKDFWFFSYLCNGVNMKDIALLKWKDIDKTKITFLRAKTARTTRQNSKPIVVLLTPEIESIIKRRGIPSDDKNNFVFGILEAQDNPDQQLKKIRQFIKTTNKYMTRIGNELNLQVQLTTYSARHSYATVLKRSGTSIEYISESLGHKDLRTTENYLDSFEDDQKLIHQSKLLDFGTLSDNK